MESAAEEPSGSTDPSAWVASFNESGFVRFPKILSSNECDDVESALGRTLDRDPSPNPLSCDGMRFASNLLYGSEELQRLLCAPGILAIVTALAGPNTWVRWDQAVWKQPGAPEFPLHQDNGYTGLQDEHLQVWIALTDTTSANGGLQIAPGWHHSDLPHHWRGGHAALDQPLATVSIDANRGDVVVFSSRLPHTTTPNMTTTTRLAYVRGVSPALGCGLVGAVAPLCRFSEWSTGGHVPSRTRRPFPPHALRSPRPVVSSQCPPPLLNGEYRPRGTRHRTLALRRPRVVSPSMNRLASRLLSDSWRSQRSTRTTSP